MNSSIILQSLKQIWGIFVLRYKYKGKLPDIKDYDSRIICSLPFHGKWAVARKGLPTHGKFPHKGTPMILLYWMEMGIVLQEKKQR